MTTNITRGAVVMTPQFVVDYSTERTSGNQVHDVIGDSNPDVTFGITSLRSGTLQLVFTTAANAIACEAQHKLPGTFVLASTETPLINMTYVPTGRIRLVPDLDVSAWTVSVQFQEVTP